MNKNVIITISRQYGSGGRTVGKMLAKRLGIPYYDREIIEMAAEDSGINAVLFQDEKKLHSLRALLGGGYQGSKLLSPESAGFTKDDNLFNYQAKIIHKLADEGSCVLIGRCADHVLLIHYGRFLSSVICFFLSYHQPPGNTTKILTERLSDAKLIHGQHV